jgi:hypothetical protein
MSLIFEGLKRNDYLKKQSAKTALQTELPEEIADSSTATASLLTETYSQTREASDPSRITVDCSPENNLHRKDDPVQIFRSEELDTASANESSLSQTQSLEIQSQSTETQYAPSTQQIERLRKGLQRSQLSCELKNLPKFDLTSVVKGGLVSSLIALKSLIVAPYKLLKFLCSAPIKSINFCSNWTVLLFTKLWESIGLLSSVTVNVFTKLFQLCYFIVLRLPILTLETVGSFFQWQWSFIRDYTTIGIHTLWATMRNLLGIKNLFSSIFQCYRTALDKILSICLPSSWIQNATIFLLKSSAFGIACCFVVIAIRNAIRSGTSPQDTENSASNLIVLKDNTTPQRKLKHFFKDPLLIKQEKVRDALLAFHIDAIQRHGNGKGQVITDNKIFGIGSLLCEHPKVFLEKIGKNSLYFSDKYGQQYKRSIENMLE